MAATSRRPSPTSQRGFTLIEVVVVVAIIALVFQLLATNMGAMIPATAMDGAAADLVARIEYLRSESRLQSKTFKLRLDLTKHGYTTVLPPEERLALSQDVRDELEINWTELGDHVRFAGCALAGDRMVREGFYEIAFDENGCTADQAIFLVNVADEKMVWTIQIRGIVAETAILESLDGKMQMLEKMEEARF